MTTKVEVLLQLMIVAIGLGPLHGRKAIGHSPPVCIHDKIAERHPHMVDLASQTGRKINKRQSSVDYSNIRIHLEYTNVDSSADSYVQGPNSVLPDSIKTLESILMVHPVQGNLIIPPICDTWSYGSNEGKCKSSLLHQSDYSCGKLATIPLSYIGTREVCTSSSGSCTTEGPNGSGVPNADYLLFISATSSSSCHENTLAYASHCMLDISGNDRPVAGYLNLCPLALRDYQSKSEAMKNLFMHELIHALGFSSSLFEKFVDEYGATYSAAKSINGPYGDTSIFTGPKTMEFGKSYHSCEDIEGVYLENEGGSGTVSSHWEKRTLNHELMNGYKSDDYEVLSEFTVALLEDSGWYKANYTALRELNQVPLTWGKGLGCPFLTHPCSNITIYPYLCDVNDSNPMCTHDHLSKGNCSIWLGFDHCPVAIAYTVQHYCRAENSISADEVDSFTNTSICVSGVKYKASYSCGIYLGNKSTVDALCVEQTSYRANNSTQYALIREGQLYGCQDGHAVITSDNWIMSCPPTDEIVSRSPLVYELPVIPPTPELDISDLDAFGNVLPATYRSDLNLESFGGVSFHNSINVMLHIIPHSIGTIPICQLFGCTTCINPIVVDSYTVVSGSVMYLVTSGSVVVSAEFTNILTQAKHYSLILMVNSQASHSFVYYAVSTLSNDGSFFRVTALTNNVEVRIAPSRNVTINKFKISYGEEYSTTLDIGESVMVTSSEDLTGSRVTANKAISFYSGHYCATGSTDNCSVLIEQIPPFNSWGNSFVLHTNVSGLIGNMFKLISSDIGASVSINCTSDGINYESNNYHLGFRQHFVLSITHHHCIVNSDENILIIQFKDTTFMTIIPAVDQFEDHYVFNTNNSRVALTVMETNPNVHPILLDNYPATVNWETVNSNTYYTVLSLPSGRHTLSFSGGSVKFGAIIYGSSGTDTYALSAGMKLDLVTDLPSQAPSPVQDAVLTLVDGMINVTWTPPVVRNGIIYQYIVQRVNSSGKFYHHVPANQHTISLPYFSDALVFVAAVNLYGQSEFENAKSQVPCHPSPCINNGICSYFHQTSTCSCSDPYDGRHCETVQKLYPIGDSQSLSVSDDGNSGAFYLSQDFTLFTNPSKKAYVNVNGIISFDYTFSEHTTHPFPLTGTDKIIAPFWADVDIRGTGNIYYRQSTDPGLLARATSEIRTAFYNPTDVSIENLLIVTWDRVGYYPSGTDKVNTFQCVLATSGSKSFAIFLYKDLQWGGGEAVAGINAGDGINFITIPGSLSQDILSLTETSNVGNPGVWIFEVDTVSQRVYPIKSFTAVFITPTTITFTWNTPPDNDRVVSWYIITCYDPSNNNFQVNVSGTDTQGEITGLTPHTTYTCTIYAFSGSDGPASDPITVTTTYQVPPNMAPKNFNVVSTTSTTITFSWKAQNFAEANGIVRWHMITCNDLTNSWIRTTITGTATQGTVTGLTPLTTYNCTIYAFNGLYGPRSDPITVTTTHPAPNPPVILSVTAIDTHSVHVTWRAPTQPNGVLNSYTIIYHIDYGSDAAIDVYYNGRMMQSYDITGLAPYQLVTVTIIAINDGGTSGNSNVMMNRSNESTPGVVHFHVIKSTNTNSEVIVMWSPPLQPNGVITSYEVMYQIYEDDNSRAQAKAKSNAKTYTIQNLIPGTPYQVRVVAFTSVGMGVLGDYVVFFSEELTPTKPPENVEANWLNSTTINVTWTPLNLFAAQGFSYYRVVLTYIDIYDEKKQLVAVANNSFAIFTNLDNDTRYSVVVGVTNNGPSSVIVDSHPIDVPYTTNDGVDDNQSVTIFVIAGGVFSGIVAIVILITVIILVKCCCRCIGNKPPSSYGYEVAPLMSDDDDSDDRPLQVTTMVELET